MLFLLALLAMSTDITVYQPLIEILWRPLALLLERTSLPPLVRILALKPEVRSRLRLCGLIVVRMYILH